MLNGLPAPNGPGRSNNYLALLLVRDYSDKYDAKVDYQINDKMTSFLRFSQRKDIQYYQPDIPGPSGGGGNGFIHAIQQQAAVGYTWTVNSTSLFEARFGFTHVLAGKVPPYLGRPEHAGSVRHCRPADVAQSDRRFQLADVSADSMPSAGRPAIRSSRIRRRSIRSSTTRGSGAGIRSRSV